MNVVLQCLGMPGEPVLARDYDEVRALPRLGWRLASGRLNLASQGIVSCAPGRIELFEYAAILDRLLEPYQRFAKPT